MCQQFVVMAHDAEGHVIGQCEHGTIHLIWTRASLYLHPAELIVLLDLLYSFQPRQVKAERGSFSLIRLREGWVQLSCDCAGLLLHEIELYSLIRLLSKASEQLNLKALPMPNRARRLRDEYRIVTAVPQAGPN
jgi:hypothetical protein